MTKEKDIKTVVPALRFPEFRDTEGWKSTILGEEIYYENGKAHENDIEESGNYIVVNSKFISTDGEVVKYTNSPNCLAEKGDILMVLSDIPNGRAIAKCFIVDLDDKYTVNQRICRLRPKNANGRLLYYIIDRNSHLLSFDDGVKQTNLKKEDVLNCPFKLPNNLLEQEKIANCLGSLDDLISAVADKIEALKEYKKGLMQQLFPADGKTTPTLRFPEFQNAGEWKETTLGEEVYYENGKAHENDIDEAGQYIVVNSKFISIDGEVVKYTDNPSCLADKGDILMVLSDVPNGRAIAKCFIVDSDNKYTVNQRICKLKPKKAVGLLLYYIINRNPFLLAFDDGIKQTNLKKDDVLNCPFRIPKDPEEQQRIANSLSSVDDLISAEADKLDQLKAHKKGLMQQLFPTLNE